MDRDSSEGKAGVTWRNRAETRSVRNGCSRSFSCTPTDQAFLGTPIVMCLLLKNA